MKLDPKLIKDFVNSTFDESKEKKTDYIGIVTEAEVIDTDTGKQNVKVKLNGSDIETPVESMMEVFVGDTVKVNINNHSATIEGNISTPAASSQTMGEVIADKELIKELVQEALEEAGIAMKDSSIAMENSSIAMKNSQFSMTESQFSMLNSIFESVDSIVKLNNSDIEALDSVLSLYKSKMIVTGSNIHLDGVTIEGENTKAKFKDDTIYISGGVYDNLVVNQNQTIKGQLTVEKLLSRYGIINTLNVNQGNVCKLQAVQINGELIDVGTLVANRIIFADDTDPKNTLYYEINMNALPDDYKNQLSASDISGSLNGAVISDGSMTALKMLVGDLTAFNATLAGYEFGYEAKYKDSSNIEHTTQMISAVNDLNIDPNKLHDVDREDLLEMISEGTIDPPITNLNYVDFYSLTNNQHWIFKHNGTDWTYFDSVYGKQTTSVSKFLGINDLELYESQYSERLINYIKEECSFDEPVKYAYIKTSAVVLPSLFNIYKYYVYRYFMDGSEKKVELISDNYKYTSSHPSFFNLLKELKAGGTLDYMEDILVPSLYPELSSAELTPRSKIFIDDFSSAILNESEHPDWSTYVIQYVGDDGMYHYSVLNKTYNYTTEKKTYGGTNKTPGYNIASPTFQSKHLITTKENGGLDDIRLLSISENLKSLPDYSDISESGYTILITINLGNGMKYVPFSYHSGLERFIPVGSNSDKANDLLAINYYDWTDLTNYWMSSLPYNIYLSDAGEDLHTSASYNERKALVDETYFDGVKTLLSDALLYRWQPTIDNSGDRYAVKMNHIYDDDFVYFIFECRDANDGEVGILFVETITETEFLETYLVNADDFYEPWVNKIVDFRKELNYSELNYNSAYLDENVSRYLYDVTHYSGSKTGITLDGSGEYAFIIAKDKDIYWWYQNDVMGPLNNYGLFDTTKTYLDSDYYSELLNITMYTNIVNDGYVYYILGDLKDRLHIYLNETLKVSDYSSYLEPNTVIISNPNAERYYLYTSIGNGQGEMIFRKVLNESEYQNYVNYEVISIEDIHSIPSTELTYDISNKTEEILHILDTEHTKNVKDKDFYIFTSGLGDPKKLVVYYNILTNSWAIDTNPIFIKNEYDIDIVESYTPYSTYNRVYKTETYVQPYNFLNMVETIRKVLKEHVADPISEDNNTIIVEHVYGINGINKKVKYNYNFTTNEWAYDNTFIDGRDFISQYGYLRQGKSTVTDIQNPGIIFDTKGQMCIGGSTNQNSNYIQMLVDEEGNSDLRIRANKIELVADKRVSSTQTEEQIIPLDDQIEWLETYSNTLHGMSTDAASSITNDLSKNMRFDSNGLTLSQTGSLKQLRLNNDRIQFLNNNREVAYWDGDTLHTGNTVVDLTERAQFGSFAFVPRSNGGISFLKVSDVKGG